MSTNIKKSAGASNSAQVSEMQCALTQAIAKQRSQGISDNVKRSIQSKLKNGEWIGKMPFGYKTVYSSSGQKSQILDAKEGTIVTYMFETYANGMESISSLSEKFGLSQNVVSNILKNSFYYGEMFVKSQNKYYPHNYPVLIEKELFEQCQEKLEDFSYKYKSRKNKKLQAILNTHKLNEVKHLINTPRHQELIKNPPFGYKVISVNGFKIIDVKWKEARIVQEIHRLYVYDQMSISDLSLKFHFQPIFILGILTNDLYIIHGGFGKYPGLILPEDASDPEDILALYYGYDISTWHHV